MWNGYQKRDVNQTEFQISSHLEYLSLRVILFLKPISQLSPLCCAFLVSIIISLLCVASLLWVLLPPYCALLVNFITSLLWALSPLVVRCLVVMCSWWASLPFCCVFGCLLSMCCWCFFEFCFFFFRLVLPSHFFRVSMEDLFATFFSTTNPTLGKVFVCFFIFFFSFLL